MASVFAWLDTDDEQQRMRVLIDLFKDEGTVDELGIGTIRDAFSSALFPGTSNLLRYLGDHAAELSGLQINLSPGGHL